MTRRPRRLVRRRPAEGTGGDNALLPGARSSVESEERDLAA
ncbi:hypothetical protein [Streptomyces sp. FBKL.4005]|nr:hypothetical protein [Streptomyces sp. FBKL.4005]